MARRKIKSNDEGRGGVVFIIIALLILVWLDSLLRGYYESNPILTIIFIIGVVVIPLLLFMLSVKAVGYFITRDISEQDLRPGQQEKEERRQRKEEEEHRHPEQRKEEERRREEERKEEERKREEERKEKERRLVERRKEALYRREQQEEEKRRQLDQRMEALHRHQVRRKEEERKRREEEERRRAELRKIREEERRRKEAKRRLQAEAKKPHVLALLAALENLKEAKHRRAEEERIRQAEEQRKRLEVLRRQESALEHMRSMNGRDFERFLADFFRKQGYEIKGTPVSADQGADLLLYKDERRIAVQAKQWAGTVGNKAVHEAHVGRTFYNTYEAWVVTTSTFTKAAIDAARRLGIRLIEGKELSAWVSKTMREEN